MGRQCAIIRGFERLEERLDAAEARLTARLAELEDRLTQKNSKSI